MMLYELVHVNLNFGEKPEQKESHFLRKTKQKKVLFIFARRVKGQSFVQTPFTQTLGAEPHVISKCLR